jgi:hypothetical protein
MAYSEPHHFLLTQQHVPSVQRGVLSFMCAQAMLMRAFHTGDGCGGIANMPFVLSSPFVVYYAGVSVSLSTQLRLTTKASFLCAWCLHCQAVSSSSHVHLSDNNK